MTTGVPSSDGDCQATLTRCRPAVDVEVSSTELPSALAQHIASQLHSRWHNQNLQAGQLDVVYAWLKAFLFQHQMSAKQLCSCDLCMQQQYSLSSHQVVSPCNSMHGTCMVTFGRRTCVACVVVHSVLPPGLATQYTWGFYPCNCTGTTSDLNLAYILQDLQQHFVTLITSLPEFLEPYQSVNADGATLRRFAIVDPDNQVQIDSHVKSGSQASHPPAKANQHHSSQPTRALPARPSISNKTSSRQPAGSTAPSNATHAGIQSALTYMQRRYGSGLTIHNPPSDPSHPLSAADPPQLVASQKGCTFALSMQPTDPAWDAKELKSLALQGHLSADYPDQGTYSLALDANQGHISSSAASIVNQLIAAEGRAHLGRPNALQQLLRFVENRAGMLFHEAEDIVLEAGQRRRHAHSLAQRPSGTIHPSVKGTTVQPSRQGQAPPPQPPPQSEAGADVQDSAPRTEHALPSSSSSSRAVSSSRHHDAHEDQAADLAADLASMHMPDESRSMDGHGVSASEQDTEGTYSDSQWDSSTSYAGYEQQTSESDYQHDSSDAEHPGTSCRQCHCV